MAPPHPPHPPHPHDCHHSHHHHSHHHASGGAHRAHDREPRGGRRAERRAGGRDLACTPHVHVHVHRMCMHTACTVPTSKVEAGFSSLVVTPRWMRRSSQRRFTPRTAASPPTLTCSCVRAVTYGSLTSYSTSLPTPSSSRSIASGPTLAKSSCARSLLVNQLVSASKVRLP